jgi:hypothetical protein
LVVGTKADQVTASSRDNIIAQVEQTFGGAAFERQLIRHGEGVVIAVDNTSDDDAGVDFVRQILVNTAPSLPGYGTPVPLGWLKFLDVVHEMIDQGRYYVSLDEARASAHKVRAHINRETRFSSLHHGPA